MNQQTCGNCKHWRQDDELFHEDFLSWGLCYAKGMNRPQTFGSEHNDVEVVYPSGYGCQDFCVGKSE